MDESAGNYQVADAERIARAQQALDDLDIAKGLEELEMGLNRKASLSACMYPRRFTSCPAARR